MKWIIVNLCQPKTPGDFTKFEERTTLDIDNIESVSQIRRKVERDGELAWETVTEIAMKSAPFVQCTDAFKDVVAAILLARSMENKRRKAGDVFCVIIDVSLATCISPLSKRKEEEEEEEEEDCPFEVGGTVERITEDMVSISCKQKQRVFPRTEHRFYKILRKFWSFDLEE
jgi:hypothetical protein